MITPEAMTKVKIITPKSYAVKVIDRLYRQKMLHVRQYEQDGLRELQTGSPLKNAEKLSQALLDLRNIKNLLKIDGRSVREPKDTSVEKIISFTDTTHDSITRLNQFIDEPKIIQFRNQLTILEALSKLKVDLKLLPKVRSVSWFLGTINDVKNLKIKKAEISHTPIGDKYLAIIFTQNKDAAQESLNQLQFTPIDIDDYKELTIETLRKNLQKLEKLKGDADKKLENLRNEVAETVIQNETILESEIKKAEIPLNFANTRSSFIASGYIPTKHFKDVKLALNECTKNNIHIVEEDIHHDDSVPIKLNNAKPVRNFEVLTKLYELPQYLEIDPSILLFITFPLFFGYMLGDVGYGIATLALFLFLKKKMPKAKQFLNVLIYASVVTIIFGFAFGEYLGFEHVSVETGTELCQTTGICLQKSIIESHGHKEVVYDFPRLLNRGHSHVNIAGYELLSVLFIGIIIGAIHLNIGLLLGFYNIWRAHGIKMAVLEKLSWIFMETGLLLAVLSLTDKIPLPIWIGILIFLVSTVMIYLGEGVKGLIELPAIFSNMLSYMRLGAVGLASLGLAVVVNENLAKPFLEKGGFFIVIAVIIMIFGHLINIALGVLGPFLHGIRLHYVEFFSKFFHGGGQKYKPFGWEAPGGD
jgi:V/A-type H+/Na+-transporting ATPase subunit I